MLATDPDLLTQRADGVEDARFKAGIVAVEAGGDVDAEMTCYRDRHAAPLQVVL